ncbi:MAG: restriction endonuclease subunit S, partial [Paludibacteraceae bacterium]|nr:restriction endonuclease subunit S [Paludibacteraceae bacterium]
MNVEMANNNNKENKVANAPLLRFPEFKDEWEETFLNDCSDYISERINTNKLSEEQYISTENMLQNFYGVENSNNVPNNSNVISFLEQDILISNIRPYLKKIWLANRNGGASTDVLVLRAKKNIEPSFLFYNLANDNFINHVMAGCKGVKMPRGDKHQILTYKLGIPSSSEQSKISDFLSLLDKRIELQKSAIEKLKSLMAGIRKYAQSLNSCKRTFLRDILTERKEKNSSL